MNIDETILSAENKKKLEDLNNPKAMKIVEKYVNLCRPSKVTVITDSIDDIKYIRELAIKNGEEKKLAVEGHTIHFDGVNDQARDKNSTKVLLSGKSCLSQAVNCGDRDEGLKEITGFMDGIMEGKEMLICFFCLGPLNSEFSISALQLTDSSYVCHSESILYRSGYEQFKNLNGSEDFFHFVHSAGQLDERGNSANIDKRRIYMDLEMERVLTVNNQYAGNSVGLKKLALRLAINKAHKEDWLCEHMFIMGVQPEGKERVTYFTGAFPSACGKTSTAMIPGQTIVGDDIAYMKINEEGEVMAVNVEQGIFGIIENVNAVDDPIIHEALTTPRELIFSNVLIADGKPYWLGSGEEPPNSGENYAGPWEEGSKVSFAHKNARYTIRINELENADEKADDPKGVPVKSVIYGGRDLDTSVPVAQSLGWQHGVFLGSCLESETTAATLGQAGVRVHNPMANIDFLVVPLGTYIENHVKFGERLDNPPLIFTTNYFLQENEKFLNEKVDKKVWILWMEGRVHGEYDAIETPIGFIPKHEDLKDLFKQVFDKDYTLEEYNAQFAVRLAKLIERFERVMTIYGEEPNIPQVFNEHMEQQIARLTESQTKYGRDVVLPNEFTE